MRTCLPVLGTVDRRRRPVDVVEPARADRRQVRIGEHAARGGGRRRVDQRQRGRGPVARAPRRCAFRAHGHDVRCREEPMSATSALRRLARSLGGARRPARGAAPRGAPPPRGDEARCARPSSCARCEPRRAWRPPVAPTGALGGRLATCRDPRRVRLARPRCSAARRRGRRSPAVPTRLREPRAHHLRVDRARAARGGRARGRRRAAAARRRRRGAGAAAGRTRSARPASRSGAPAGRSRVPASPSRTAARPRASPRRSPARRPRRSRRGSARAPTRSAGRRSASSAPPGTKYSSSTSAPPPRAGRRPRRPRRRGRRSRPGSAPATSARRRSRSARSSRRSTSTSASRARARRACARR